MFLIGIIDIENSMFANVADAREKLFRGCVDGIDSVEIFTNSSNDGSFGSIAYTFTLVIRDVQIVERLVSNVRRHLRENSLKLLLNGKNIDVNLLK